MAATLSGDRKVVTQVAADTAVAAADTAEATRLKAVSKVAVEATRAAMMITLAQAEVATAEVATVDPAVVQVPSGEVATKTQVAQEEDMAVVTTTPAPMVMISLLMAAMVDLAMVDLVWASHPLTKISPLMAATVDLAMARLV